MRSLMRSLAVVAVLLVAGCTASGGDSATVGTDDSAGSEESADGGGEAAEAPAEDTAGGDLDVGSPAAVDLEDRQFVVEGTISMTVEDPSAAAAEAARLVEQSGGFVQERVEESGGEDEPGRAYLVVRVPSTEVSRTIEALKELGEIEDTTLTSTEVTAQARDLDARIRALEISITRLEDLLDRAGSIEDIVNAEQVLTERQVQLEQLQSQRAGLANQVSMATFRLDLWSEGTVIEIEEEPTGFFAGLAAGWNALVATLTGLLQVIGAVLPWLAFAALVTAVVIAVARAMRRRRPATAPVSAHPSGPTTSLPPQQPAQPEPAASTGWPGAPTAQQGSAHPTEPGATPLVASPSAGPADTSGTRAAPSGDRPASSRRRTTPPQS